MEVMNEKDRQIAQKKIYKIVKKMNKHYVKFTEVYNELQELLEDYASNLDAAMYLGDVLTDGEFQEGADPFNIDDELDELEEYECCGKIYKKGLSEEHCCGNLKKKKDKKKDKKEKKHKKEYKEDKAYKGHKLDKAYKLDKAHKAHKKDNKGRENPWFK